MSQSPYLEFSVRYRLGEYLEFAIAHAFATEDALRILTGLKKRLARTVARVILSTMFLYKSSRVGRCHFRIDSSGLSRRSNGGEVAIPWSKISSIHTYKPGYLVEMQKGAMPIPFRALSSEQTQIFRDLAGELISNHAPSNNSFKPNPHQGGA